VAILAGFVLTAIWSAPFVDSVIGDSVANGLLGYDAKATPISGVLAGTLFAFVSGLAGSFTACNIAAFGAVAPLVGGEAGQKRSAVKPLGWIAAGMLTVSIGYGVIVALVGTRMPQFSTAQTTGLSPRSIQSMIAFGVVGLVFLAMGLIALGIVGNPFAGFTRRHPAAPLVLMQRRGAAQRALRRRRVRAAVGRQHRRDGRAVPRPDLRHRRPRAALAGRETGPDRHRDRRGAARRRHVHAALLGRPRARQARDHLVPDGQLVARPSQR
jgi:hypothetical protein